MFSLFCCFGFRLKHVGVPLGWPAGGLAGRLVGWAGRLVGWLAGWWAGSWVGLTDIHNPSRCKKIDAMKKERKKAVIELCTLRNFLLNPVI